MFSPRCSGNRMAVVTPEMPVPTMTTLNFRPGSSMARLMMGALKSVKWGCPLYTIWIVGLLTDCFGSAGSEINAATKCGKCGLNLLKYVDTVHFHSLVAHLHYWCNIRHFGLRPRWTCHRIWDKVHSTGSALVWLPSNGTQAACLSVRGGLTGQISCLPGHSSYESRFTAGTVASR